ncbi:MAG: peptidase T [Candidatus Hodarchaeota archaeon]
MPPDVLDRFLRYVKIHTTSKEGVDTIPSTAHQFNLAHLLVKELKELGLENARVDDHCYVLATLPSNIDIEVPTICLLAHMDTSPEESGENVKPQVIKNYDGSDIVLPGNQELIISAKEDPALKKYIGSDIVTSDGTTLLGGDDKAGVAEIMAAIAMLVKSPEIKHGEIKIVFTPDEEVGNGVAALDVESLGADVGYTLDGDEMGCLENETFCASSITIKCSGYNTHPGYAIDKLVNAIRVIASIISSLPRNMAPETTEGRVGYIHPYILSEGSVNSVSLKMLLRDFEWEGIEQKFELVKSIIQKVQSQYPKAVIEDEFQESYRNMKYKIPDYVVEYAEEAIRRAGLNPIRKPIRGGTDGARLSYMGLPTPNIFSGAMNFHSKKEYVPVVAMEKAVETILHIIQIYVEKSE